MYKIGFLGGGVNSIAGKIHLIASEMDRKFKVIGGIFSKNKQQSIKSAKEYNLKHFNSIKEMAKEVDLIAILTPTPEHFNNLKEVLKEDVGIIVDKPLVSNLEEAKELLPLLKNKFCIVTHNYSGYPLVREIKYLIQNKKVNKIVIKMPQESFLKPLKEGYPQKWRIKDGKIDTITLDLGVHVYHLAKFIYPKNLKIIYQDKKSFSKFNVIDDVDIIAEFSDGVKAVFSYSKISLGNANSLSIEVFCEDIGIKWNQEDNEHLYLTYSNGKKEILSRNFAYFEANKSRYQRMSYGHPSGFIEAFANLYTDIYDSFSEFRKKTYFESDFVFDYNHSIDSLKFFQKGSDDD